MPTLHQFTASFVPFGVVQPPLRPHGPLLSLCPADQLAALQVGGNPSAAAAAGSHQRGGNPPASMAAIHHMFGIAGGSGAPAAAAAPKQPLAPPPAGPGAAAQHMLVGALAAAAMEGQQQPRQKQHRDQEEQDEALQRLNDLPSENLPLLAAAAQVAEEIERTEIAVAAAFSVPALLQQPQHQLQPPQQQYPAAAPSLLSPRHARRILSLQPAAAPV